MTSVLPLPRGGSYPAPGEAISGPRRRARNGARCDAARVYGELPDDLNTDAEE